MAKSSETLCTNDPSYDLKASYKLSLSPSHTLEVDKMSTSEPTKTFLMILFQVTSKGPPSTLLPPTNHSDYIIWAWMQDFGPVESTESYGLTILGPGLEVWPRN